MLAIVKIDKLNVVDPTIALTEFGADNVRWYLLYASPVWTPLKYDDTKSAAPAIK
mgnify:CR=1 FL=1